MKRILVAGATGYPGTQRAGRLAFFTTAMSGDVVAPAG